MDKHAHLPVIPHCEMSVGAVLAMRELLPHIVAWLRAREAATRRASK